MGDSKKNFKFGFKKKDKKNVNDFNSPMFKSPSHYWNASQTDFLHSKGSANVELSIDPFNKSLIRVFCQSVDNMVNYKSIEYCSRTTVLQIIEKILKILRLNKSNNELVLIETVGRCLLIAKDGSTTKIVAKSGQPYIYIEQNRRTLMSSDYILTVLNYWKPMIGFSRRFELCLAEKNYPMSSCDGETNDNESYLPSFDSSHDTLSTSSQKSNIEFESKSTQTDQVTVPPVAPRRRLSMKSPKLPHLLTLKGDDVDDQDLLISINPKLEFGSPNSSADIILKQLTHFPNQKICTFNRMIEQDNGEMNGSVIFKNLCVISDLIVSVNGIEVSDQMILQPGDIVSIGDFYSYFFKDLSTNHSEKRMKIKHFVNHSTKKPEPVKRIGNHYSDLSDHAITSSSISSCSDINSTLSSSKINKYRKKVSIDLHGISLSCFDTALNQVIIHYFDGRMNLMDAVMFALYLIRFCRESTRCSFSLDEMQDRIKKRFAKALETAYSNDYYLLGNLKLTAFTFQLWLVYNNENCIEATEENRYWLDFLESFTADSFDHLSSYICETAQNLSSCFFEENPFRNFDDQQNHKENEDTNTIKKFLSFLTDTYQMISKIDDQKMSDILKTLFTSRILIHITESTVIQILSDLKSFNWNKGIQITSQLEKFENWLIDEELINIFETDGFLRDFAKLISTRVVLLKQMNWRAIRLNHSKIPLSVLNQFLTGIASDNIKSLTQWQPIPNEIKQSNRDFVEVLSEYLRLADTFTLFQPGIVLQTDCIPIDKLMNSVDFVSYCTVFDTELIAMGENFQWMSLPKPQSLINFKHGKWLALRQSIEESNEFFTPVKTLRSPHIPDRRSSRQKMQTDSDYSSISNKDDTKSHKNIIERYRNLKNNLNNYSKSLVSLNETDSIPKPPRRKKNKGSFSNLINPNNTYLKNLSKSRGSFGNKSCVSRIGRSDSNISDVSHPIVIDIDTDRNSCINDVDQSIEEMEREIQDPISNWNKSPCTDDEDEDEISMGLSATGFSNRIKAYSKSNGDLIDIDEKKQIEITLSKSSDESYGITLADGTQTSLKCEGIFIYQISRYSPASKNGKMKPGDRIIAINNYAVEELTFEECLMLITKSLTSVKLLIEKSDLKTTLGIMSIYQ